MSLPGRFLSIGGQRIFFHRTGRGRPLLLLHGYLVSHWVWRHVIPELAREHDVIAFDLPGFGESDRPPHADFRYDAGAFLETIVGVLDALELERASFVGHSLGGSLALYAAARRPDRVERLVVVDPIVYPFPVPIEGQIIRVPYLGPLIFRRLYTRGMLRRYLATRVYLDPALAGDEWVGYVWERLNRPGGFEAAHAALALIARPTPIARSLRAIRAPTMVVWGAEDRLVPASFAARLCSEISGAQARLIPGCGHAPQEERPAELVEVIAPFLAATEGKRAPITAVMS